MSVTGESDDYARGHRAGGIAERLDSHDRHFVAINGSLADIARELSGLRLAVQGLADRARSDAGERITVAAALRDTTEARRSASDRSWSPVARVITVAAVLLSAAGLVFAAITLAR